MDLRGFVNANYHEQSLFRHAIKNSISELVYQLTDGNSNLKDQVLHVAAHFGNIKILKQYITEVDVNAKGLKEDNCLTPVQRAVSMNHFHVVKFLIQRGANVDTPLEDKCHGNCSTLNIAINNHPDNLDMIKFLLKNGADANHSCDKCLTPLVKAISDYQERIVDVLLRYRADVNLQCNFFGDKITPLYMAVRRDQLRIVKLLISKNADVSVVTPVRRQSILHAGIPAAGSKVIECILSAGVDLSIVDSSDQIPVELGRSKKYNSTLTIKEHLVKMKAADLFLSERNLKVINDSEFDKLHAACCKEVEVLKKCRIAHTRVTFYDLLHNDEQSIALKFKCVKEENIVNYCKEFPLYSSIIDYHLKRVLIKQERLENVDSFFNDLFWNVLPDTFVRNISYYLDEDFVEELYRNL